MFITILGPTASGKSALAMQLAKEFNGAIICADSRTVYRELNIGAAKPTDIDRQKIEHYGLDLISPNENFSAAEFKNYTQKVIKKIEQKNQLPFLVGGSGLYIDSVLFDYKFRNPKTYPDRKTDSKSLEELAKIAQKLYPLESTQIDLKNRRRVEQLITKGPTKDDDRKELSAKSLVLGIKIDTETLERNITARTEQMCRSGFVQEVESLIQKYGLNCPALKTTGYWPIVRFIQKEISVDVAKAAINKETLALAKKQMTWFRRNEHITWVEPDAAKMSELITQYIKSS